MRLNLNEYRNAPYFKLNNAKVNFKNEPSIKQQIEQLPVFDKVKLTYVIHYDFNKAFDVANIGAVADKFFSDALVEAGKLTDDNFKYVSQVSYKFGSIDKVNPRIEVYIHHESEES